MPKDTRLKHDCLPTHKQVGGETGQPHSSGGALVEHQPWGAAWGLPQEGLNQRQSIDEDSASEGLKIPGKAREGIG